MHNILQKKKYSDKLMNNKIKYWSEIVQVCGQVCG